MNCQYNVRSLNRQLTYANSYNQNNTIQCTLEVVADNIMRLSSIVASIVSITTINSILHNTRSAELIDLDVRLSNRWRNYFYWENFHFHPFQHRFEAKHIGISMHRKRHFQTSCKFSIFRSFHLSQSLKFMKHICYSSDSNCSPLCTGQSRRISIVSAPNFVKFIQITSIVCVYRMFMEYLQFAIYRSMSSVLILVVNAIAWSHFHFHSIHIGLLFNFGFFAINRASVRLGEYDISNDPDCSTSGFCAPTVINHMISHVIIHPDYKHGQYHHDIALVILKTPLNYTGELRNQ